MPNDAAEDVFDVDDEALEMWEAAKRLGSGPRLRGSQVDELLARACDRTNHLSAETAVYALGFATVTKRRLHHVTVRLLDIVDDSTRPDRIRGQAAEGVGDLLELTKQSTLRRTATLRLTKHLADASPEVRFWAAFSLGKLRARSARTALAGLVGDEATLPGWWSVGKEAADALDMIAGRHSRSVRIQHRAIGRPPDR